MSLVRSEDEARSSRLGWIPIRGDSMWPSLKTGDEAHIVPLEREPTVGKVVLARISGVLVLHRVEGRQGAALVLRGDNCVLADAPVPLEQVLGTVGQVRRGGQLTEGWDVGRTWLGRARLVLKRVMVRRWP
jgi:signal peptidase I